MPVVLVLREAASYDRPVRAPKPVPADPVHPPERVVAEPPRRPEPPQRLVPAPESGPLEMSESMLAGLARATESDERSIVRRVAALMVLLTLTLATAALIGAGIYRVVAGLD